jgi:hypothetical protein
MKFNLKEIESLSRPQNHTIKFDGYDFWWYSRINNKWSIHCINSFESRLKALSYIKFWLNQYQNDVINSELFLGKVTDSLADEFRIYDIVKNENYSTFTKVQEIHNINNKLSQTEISNYLNLTKKAVNKHFLKLSKKVVSL